MSQIDWTACGSYREILFHKADGIAKITINRPHVRNAFTPLTVEEMMDALRDATNDSSIGVVILTGAGDLAFCSGGDQKVRGHAGYQDSEGVDRLNVLEFQRQMRRCPLPIVAMVAGFAIGGGHVLHVMCDLTIAAETPCSARPARASDRSTAASAPATWRASSARRRRGRSGTCASATTRRRRWRWAWSTRWCRWPTWSRKP